MVWIEATKDTMKAIWIDGNIPSFKELEKKRKKYLDQDNFGYLQKKPSTDYTKDEMFRRLICFLIKDNQIKNNNYIGQYDIFLMRYYELPRPILDIKKYRDCSTFSNLEKYRSLKIPLSPFYDIFNTELKKKEDKDSYRQIIAAFSPFQFKCGKKLTNDLLKELDFKIKDPNEYKDYAHFEYICKDFLESYFLKPYVNPDFVAEEILNLIGFETLYSQIK